MEPEVVHSHKMSVQHCGQEIDPYATLPYTPSTEERKSKPANWDDPQNPYVERPPSDHFKLEQNRLEESKPEPPPPTESTVPKRVSSLKSTNTISLPRPPTDYRTPLALQQLSPYLSIHVDSPCTAGDLTHRLKCTHRILTSQAEVCATNCLGSFTRYANPRDLDKDFNCPVCINRYLHLKYADVPPAGEAQLVDEGRHWGNWFKTTVGYVPIVKRALLAVEQLDLRRRGRECGAVYDPVSFQFTGTLCGPEDWLDLGDSGERVSPRRDDVVEHRREKRSSAVGSEGSVKTESAWKITVPVIARMTSGKRMSGGWSVKA